MSVVRRALLSCFDKTGLDVFAKELAALGVELIASGGTAEFLRKQGLRVKTVEEFAGITEQLDGRVKTLHPKIHAGILARRDAAEHLKAVGEEGLIDLVVVNLYPFEQTVQRPTVSLAEALEQIDIGGVALLRAAAKNFLHVGAISEPGQYAAVTRELRERAGALGAAMREQLAAAGFTRCSAYDASIAAFLERQLTGDAVGTAEPGGSGQADRASSSQNLPERASVSVRRRQTLRYGENPHQQAGWYVSEGGHAEGLSALEQLQGKELSYNNLLDLDAALRCLADLDEPACVIVKHTMPCGVALGPDPLAAYERAYVCDPESAFGGIVGVNRPLDEPLAKRLAELFLEVVLAPSIESAARTVLAKKPNLRLVVVAPSQHRAALQWRQLLGTSWLLQQPDASTRSSPSSLRVTTSRQPTSQERQQLAFAWAVAKHAKSNAVVLAKDRATVAIGQGQPSRVRAVRLAIQNAGERARGAVMASDGFFPFPDNVELAAEAGVSAIIQPGGSIKDAQVIAAAERAGIAMVLTGVRHFRH